MKPWIELTDEEKREAIARRLGWGNIRISAKFCGLHDVLVGSRRGPGISMAELLPDWPTNDGLAFTEVWPKLIDHRWSLVLALNECLQVTAGVFPATCVAVPSVLDMEDRNQLGANTAILKLVCSGETWAAAICRAAYELLPEPK